MPRKIIESKRSIGRMENIVLKTTVFTILLGRSNQNDKKLRHMAHGDKYMLLLEKPDGRT